MVAASLRERTGIAYRPEDVAMTRPARSLRSAMFTIRALADEGDEVIFLSPPWFFCELMIASAGATAGAVRLGRPRSISIRTRSRRRSLRGRAPSWSAPARTTPTGRIYGAARSTARSGRCCARRRNGADPRCSPTSSPQPSSSTMSTSAARARLRGDDHDLHVRQDDARSRPADRVRRAPLTSRTAKPSGTGSSSSSSPPAQGLSECPAQRDADLEGLSIDARRSRRAATAWCLRFAEMGYEVLPTRRVRST